MILVELGQRAFEGEFATCHLKPLHEIAGAGERPPLADATLQCSAYPWSDLGSSHRWSFSSPMFRYRLVDHAVPAMWRSLAAARFRADCPSPEAPTTRVRPPDLAQDVLERVIGADPPPMLLREGVVGQRLLSHPDCRAAEDGALRQDWN
jgi:hypothetical protein